MPEGAFSQTFFQAAGVAYIDVAVDTATSENRQIQSQADEFYYSGHGDEATGRLQPGGPTDVRPYWEDLDLFVASGCSVLDINDYNNNVSGANHLASPGKKWETVGPSALLGYNYKAPKESQGSTRIITTWCANRLSLGSIDAWQLANNNRNGRNACAIEKEAFYFYFAKGGVFPFNTYMWTAVAKSAW